LFWARLVDWSQGRTLVGQDDFGRKYYVSREDRPRVSSALERRTFDGDADVELPAEWLAWLRHTRTDPPTPEESKQLADARAERRRRVEALQVQEQQRKTRAKVQGTQTGEGAGAEQLGGDTGRSTRDWQPDRWQ
jgi:NADH:ubiquinone oxidoreductase subunit